MLRTLKIIGSLLIIIVLMLGSGVLPNGNQAAGDDQGNVILQPFEPPERGNPKLDSQLNQMVSANTSRAESFSLEKDGGALGDVARVIVECLPGKAEDIIHEINNYGSFEASYENLLQVTVPVNQLTALAGLPDVKIVRAPERPVLFDIVSQGVDSINADDWQAAGYGGAGVKIGILDAGFEGYTSLLGTELPASVTTQSFVTGGDITGPSGSPQVHGTACAEIVYDIAPDAQYYLTNFATDVEMGNAVNWLINTAQVDIISCSCGFLGFGPGDGTGWICDMVTDARTAGILWSQSIGNQAQCHWQGDWADSNTNGFLDFVPGVDELNAVWLDSSVPITVTLNWDDPWGASSNDYDLLLFDNTLVYPTGVVALSDGPQNGSQDPFEGFRYTAAYTGWHYIAVGRASATGSEHFHLHSYPYPIERYVPFGSFVIPADSPDAMTVGAVPWNNPASIEPFSSRGPNNAVPPLIKPDLVATDNVSNVTYSPFMGTSASTPHAAGAAALVKQLYPLYEPDDIQAFLEGNAVDLGIAGKDNIFGSGRLYLGDAPVTTGSISGTVTDLDTGDPIAGATVIARDYYQMPPTTSFSATTDGDGHYTITSLPAGDYLVNAIAAGHERLFYPDTYFPPNADPVTVTIGGNTSGINFSLGPGGSISGTTTDDVTGLPAGYVSVMAIPFDQSPGGWFAISDGNGNYSITGLPYGSYLVMSPAQVMSASGDDGYAREFWQDALSYTTATTVEVSAVSSPDNIDFALEVGGSISGVVLDEATSQPVTDNSSGSVYLDTGWHKFIYRQQEYDGGQASRAAFKAPGDGSWRVFSTFELDIRTAPDAGAASGITLINKKSTWDYPQNHAEMVQCVDIDATAEPGWYGESVVTQVYQNENIHGNDDYYTSYYEGYFYVSSAGTWYFSTDSDDASEITIDDQVVACWYGGHGSTNRWDHKMDIRLSLYDTHEWVMSTQGEADGSYLFEKVHPGTYIIEAASQGYINEYYDDAPTPNEASGIVVVAATETPGIALYLQSYSEPVGGSISGTVYETDGQTAIQGAIVTVYSFNQAVPMPTTTAGQAVTDVSGQYSITGLPAGSYRVEAVAPNHERRWYQNVQPMAQATEVIVSAGVDTSSIDFLLGPGGTISGTVWNADHSAILPGVSVIAQLSIPGPSGVVTITLTDENGDYTLDGLAYSGYWITSPLVFGGGPGDDNYMTEVWQEKPNFDGAPDTVTVAEGVNPINIDFTLEQGCRISGHITQEGGAPINGASVTIYDYSSINNYWVTKGIGRSGADGYYISSAVPIGTYGLRVQANGYASEWWNNIYAKDFANPVEVTGTGEITGYDFELAPGGSISGHIQDSGSAPIANMHVQALDSTNNRWIAGVNTDASGNYTLSGLPAGGYYVRTCVICSGTITTPFIDEFFNNAYVQQDAQTVTVTPTGDTPNINFSLELGGAISGHVSDSGGDPVEGAQINVFLYDSIFTGQWVGAGWARTDASGNYATAGLPDGQYAVQVSHGDYATEWYDNIFWQQAATPVTIAGAVSQTDINFELEQGGTISGRITDSTGTPLANVSVDAERVNIPTPPSWGATSDADGYYTISGLPLGQYKVRSPVGWGSGDDGYLMEYYNNKPDVGSADVVTISPDATGIDFALEIDVTPPTITSTVPDTDAMDVAVDTDIQVTFSEPMNTASVEGAFSLPGVTGSFSWAGNTMTFDPDANLDSNTPYTVTIGTTATDLAGNPMAAVYSWSFTTTDIIAPTVTSTVPDTDAMDVAVNTNIQVTFSEPMNTASVEGAFSLPGVTGSFSWASNTMTFDPDANLDSNTPYTVTIGATATDLAGNPMAAVYSWSFTTEKIIPTVTTNEASGITIGSADLNMSYDFRDYGSGQVRFAYKKAEDTAWTYTSWVAETGSGTYAETVGGLSSNTLYDFKALLKYDTSEMEGLTLQFTTEKRDPEVTTGAASDITDMTATLHGNLDSMVDYDTVDVSFVWGLDSVDNPAGSYPNEISATPASLTVPGAFSADLTDLNLELGYPYTYYFRAKATAGSVIVFGEEKSFTTYANPIEVWVNQAWEGLSLEEPTDDGHIFGYNAFSTIQDGIDYVENLVGTVNVYDGEYNEYVSVGTSITIRSVDGNASVNATGLSENAFYVNADSVTITGFTVTGASEPSAGIYLYQAHHCQIYGNNIINNDVGISLDSSNNNTIANNIIRDNSHGIRIDTSNDNVIEGNDILDNIYVGGSSATGIHLSGDSSGNAIHFNNILGNSPYGLNNESNTGNVSAENNWWGDASGPGGDVADPGSGDNVSTRVNFKPWLTVGVVAAKSQAVTGSTLDAKSEADTEVEVAGSADVTVAEYAGNPGGTVLSNQLGKYIDVHIGDVTNVTEIVIKLYYTDAEISGKDESSLKLYWWDSSTSNWTVCSNTGVNPAPIYGYSGYIWAIISSTTTPNLAQLTGTPFGTTGLPAESTPATPPSGGGGGGGGSAGGIIELLPYLTADGMLTSDVSGTSSDDQLTLVLYKGTLVKNRVGSQLYVIRITQGQEAPALPADAVNIGLVYTIDQYGATFNPAITLILSYDDTELPQGVSENNLFVAGWDASAEKWIKLDSSVNPGNNTVSTMISQFLSKYAIMIYTRPASFAVSKLLVTPAQVKLGDSTSVTVLVTNTGDLTGSYEVTLKIDNVTAQTKQVTIDGGDSVTVSFSVTPATAGVHTVSIGDLSGSCEVKAPETVATPEPKQTPTPTPTPSPAPALTPTPTPTPTPASTPTSPVGALPVETPTNWGLIGGIIAACAVVIGLLVYFLVWRRRTAQ